MTDSVEDEPVAADFSFRWSISLQSDSVRKRCKSYAANKHLRLRDDIDRHNNGL